MNLSSMKQLALILALLLALPANAGRSFNGSSDVIQIAGTGVDLTGQSAMTMVCWFQVASVPGSEAEICAKGGHAVYEGYYINLSQSGHSGQIGAHWYQNESLAHNVDLFCSFSVSINTWYSVVMVWNSSGGGNNPGAFLIVNGTTCASGSNNASLGGGSTAVDFCVGGYASGGTTCNVANFAGIVAEVAIWNVALGTCCSGVALTPTNAFALAAICPVGPSARRAGLPNPIGYWPLYGASGSSIEPDLSGNGLNGTLTGTSPANHPPCTP